MRYMLTIICLLFAGCATPALTRDDGDPRLVTMSNTAKERARNWYVRKWGEQPRNTPYRHVYVSPDPIHGGAWSTGNRIVVWEKQITMNTVEHEWRHAWNMANGKGGPEGSQEAEEAVR